MFILSTILDPLRWCDRYCITISLLKAVEHICLFLRLIIYLFMYLFESQNDRALRQHRCMTHGCPGGLGDGRGMWESEGSHLSKWSEPGDFLTCLVLGRVQAGGESPKLACWPGLLVHQAWETSNELRSWTGGGLRSQTSIYARSLRP